MSEVEVACAILSPFGAGIDTFVGAVQTVSTMPLGDNNLLTFCRAVCATLHKDVAHKLQAQLETVVGRARLPGIADVPSLPYFRAGIKEVMREVSLYPYMSESADRSPQIPSYCAARDTARDDGKQHISKGSCEGPFYFPERFLAQNDFALPFGFGWRVCPGMHVGMQSGRIVVARSSDGNALCTQYPLGVRAVAGAGWHTTPERVCQLASGSRGGPAPGFAVNVRERDGHVAKSLEGVVAETRLRNWPGEHEVGRTV
ncbi:hypothetical protein FA95DRAFT_1577245 [Auriscalpium vulgare]|uniref:Uncharacterized protein n=1 Tax=Auriscalpium vulgare TaxID=40419 RepID=A0ACB8R7V9_9AGAM|nr:hypothetical protein FA95DRAFT_1577245 [Auriscalpium vulgare]